MSFEHKVHLKTTAATVGKSAAKLSVDGKHKYFIMSSRGEHLKNKNIITLTWICNEQLTFTCTDGTCRSDKLLPPAGELEALQAGFKCGNMTWTSQRFGVMSKQQVLQGPTLGCKSPSPHRHK